MTSWSSPTKHTATWSDREKGWDVSRAKLKQSLNVSSQDTSLEGVFFKTDGTRMYTLGTDNESVYQYDLSIPWDISTSVFSASFSLGGIAPESIYFREDGLKMYVLANSGDRVREYDLSSAWNIATASFLQFFSCASQDNTVRGLFFKDDGTAMYVAGNQNDRIYQYSLSSPWNVSTAVFSKSFSVSVQTTSPEGLFFKPDGTKMYLMAYPPDSDFPVILEYDLTNPWDVATLVFYQRFFPSILIDIFSFSVFFKPDGIRMYITSNDIPASILEFSLEPIWSNPTKN